jgi:hypothetical protein
VTTRRSPDQEWVGGGAFTGMLVLSLVVLFTPSSGVPGGLGVNDKVVHFVLFAALAVTGRMAAFAPLPLALGLLGYAGVSEVLQSVLPLNRDGDLLDVLADGFGVLTGLLAAHLLRGARGEP